MVVVRGGVVGGVGIGGMVVILVWLGVFDCGFSWAGA